MIQSAAFFSATILASALSRLRKPGGIPARKRPPDCFATGCRSAGATQTPGAYPPPLINALQPGPERFGSKGTTSSNLVPSSSELISAAKLEAASAPAFQRTTRSITCFISAAITALPTSTELPERRHSDIPGLGGNQRRYGWRASRRVGRCGADVRDRASAFAAAGADTCEHRPACRRAHHRGRPARHRISPTTRRIGAGGPRLTCRCSRKSCGTCRCRGG